MSLRSAIFSQFERPRGLLGRIAGWILAGRGENLRRNRWTVDLLAPVKGDHVLEAGCGPGVALQMCLAIGGVRAVGVDHSDVMIAQATARNRKAVRSGRLKLIRGTIDAVEGVAGFDKAFSINVIQFVDQTAFVGEMKRLLKPGGLLATTYQPRHKGATRDDAFKLAASLQRVLSAAGFTDLRTEELPMKVPAVCVLARRGA